MTVVDAVGGEYYARQHLPGAIPLVEDDVANRAGNLPNKATPVVTSRSNPGCPTSQRVADRLIVRLHERAQVP